MHVMLCIMLTSSVWFPGGQAGTRHSRAHVYVKHAWKAHVTLALGISLWTCTIVILLDSMVIDVITAAKNTFVCW